MLSKLKSFFNRSDVKWTILLVFAIVIFLHDLGGSGMYSAQEGRAGIIVRNMVDSGDYGTMVFKGRDTTEKPIFYYWICLASSMQFGNNEFGIRLPSAIASIICVIMAALFGRRIYGENTGILAGLILATMISFINFGRIARIDIVLAAFYTVAMYFMYCGYAESKKGNWKLYIFYAVLGLSVLVKGPVTVVLAGLTAICLAIKERSWRVFWELKPISGFIIGSAITLPWYIREGIRTHGEYTTGFLISHNIKRFTGIDSEFGGGKKKNVLFYIPNIIGGTLPWSIFLPFGLWKFWQKRKSLSNGTWFLIFWALVVFAFFSLSAYKRADYLLPLYPAIAVLIAQYIIKLEENSFKLASYWKIATAGFGVLLLGFLTLVRSGIATKLATICLSDKVPCISERDARSALKIFEMINTNSGAIILAVLITLIILSLLGMLMQKGRCVYAAVLLAFSIWTVHWMTTEFVLPYADSYKSLRDYALEFKSRINRNEMIAHVRAENLEELVFYLPNDYDEIWYTKELLDANGKLKYKYLIFREETFDSLDENIKIQIREVVRTRPEHQYPSVFCISEEEAKKLDPVKR